MIFCSIKTKDSPELQTKNDNKFFMDISLYIFIPSSPTVTKFTKINNIYQTIISALVYTLIHNNFLMVLNINFPAGRCYFIFFNHSNQQGKFIILVYQVEMALTVVAEKVMIFKRFYENNAVYLYEL